MVARRLVASRSQAENYIELGRVKLNGMIIRKAGALVGEADQVKLESEQYVSRAGLKLASVATKLSLNFKDQVVLDVGSSTGGFSDFALQHGAKKVIAVDVGSDQFHPKLRGDERVELHEKTDIRSFTPLVQPDIVLIDVSFISLREILPAVAALGKNQTRIVAMLKPQFEAGAGDVNKGVVKNDKLRRRIMKDFELWLRGKFVVVAKADSEVAGEKGNHERFYLLKKQI